jgi:hypothetical protein
MSEQRRYLLISTVETTQVNDDGTPCVIPAGTTLNEVLWDGVTAWTPPEGTRTVLAPNPGAAA